MKRTSSKLIAIVFGLALVITGLMRTARAEDWQPISKEDLDLKDNPKNPGASAMILYRESSVDTTEAFIDEYVRIKIFTESGKKWGNIELHFFKGHYDIHNVRARTIRPDGSVVNFDGKVYEKEVYKGSDIKWLVKTFSLAEVQPGCIIEYRYREQHERGYLVEPRWVVNHDLFTRFARFHFHPYHLEVDYPLFWRRYNLPNRADPQKKGDGTYVLEMHDIPGVEEERYMAPREVLESRLEFFYREPDEPTNETPERFWKRIGKKWNDSMEHFINRKGALESELSQIVSASGSQETKLRKIYARVQKIRNTDIDIEKTRKEQKLETPKKNDNVEDVLKHGYGSSREINYVFIALARAAGVDATSVRVAPRNQTVFYPALEDTNELNDDLVCVKLTDKDVYLDPSVSYYPYGLLPWYETGVSGLRLNKQGGEFVTTTLPEAEDAKRERRAELTMDADGNLSGKISVDYFGLSGSLRREQEREEDEAGKKKDNERLIHEWLPAESSFEISQMSGWEDNTVPLHIEGKVRMAGFGSTTGRRILAPVTIFRSSEAQAFEPAKRVNNIYFHYPYCEHDEIVLRVPEGYSIETVPPAQQTPKEAVLDYGLTAAAQGNAVHVDRSLHVKAISFEVKYYAAIRSFFNLVKNNDESQFVLTSAQAAARN